MTNPFSLTGRTILVTGASSGIGRQTCITIAQMGGTVVATGRDQERLAQTLAALEGQGHSSFPADLVHAAERAALLKAVPPLDGLVHCAGIVKHTPLAYASEAKLDELMAVNYKAPLLLTQGLAKARQLRDGASIVFISSTAALFAAKAIGVYAATKGAIIASARVLALELAPRRIRVNCLAPAMVLTPMAEQTARVVTEEAFAEHEKEYLLGFGKPEDVAGAAVFLLSEAGRWITGTTIIMDGGYTCK